jgi:small-conductance mechanosensitive channel
VPEVPHEILESEAVRSFTWQRGLAALGTLVLFIVGSKLAGYLVRRAIDRPGAFALSKLLTYFIVVIGFLTALGVLGVPVASLLLTSSALLVGVGFSLQHVSRDIIGGIVILMEQSIRKNDFVTFGDTFGTVQQIGLRSTQLLGLDGTTLIVPNHLLISSEVSNHSSPLERRLLTVEVPVSLREDVETVRETLLGLAGSHARVLSEPPPMVHLDAILDSHFTMKLLAWVSDPVTSVRVASELRFAIVRAFERRGIEFPTQELRLRGLPRAVRQGPGPAAKA